MKCTSMRLVAALAALAACNLESPNEPLDEREQAAIVPAKGTASTLDVASWNIEWFGDTANGPTDEALQLANARDVIAGTDFDVWGLIEIVGASQFASLKAQLPGYAGLLANEPSVVNGPAYYSDFGNAEQKVGILYKTQVASVLGASVILTQNNNDFAGRPPLEVRMRVTLGGTTEDIVVIVMHPKCCTDSTSYQRRVTAANALKAYLDATYPTQKVWVIGDYNDDVDTSITTGRASPYQGFVTDTARYLVPTKALSDARISSTVSFTDTIDHHAVTNEAGARLVPGSAEVYRVDSYLAGYGNTTSDHYPVLTRYTFGGGGTTPSVTVSSPNGGATYTAGTALPITWASSAVTAVRIEATYDGGATWSQLLASTPAAAGSYTWTVPAIATTAARVRVSDTASAASDTSDAAFAISLGGGGTANVVINEILANEPGSTTAAEAIELVNIGTATAAIGGWTLSDASSTRHVFAAGTQLLPGAAIVVFGGASAIPVGASNAVAASTGSLGLGNSGDTVTLRQATTTIGTFTYTSALSGQDGVSMNRSPDGGGSATFVLHTALSALSSSPGKRVSGAAW